RVVFPPQLILKRRTFVRHFLWWISLQMFFRDEVHLLGILICRRFQVAVYFMPMFFGININQK
ncbi:MAG: hypothetical protein UV60_C0001G0001, partial [Parcubacteria group bacterium GW2011_GWA2_43_11]